RPNRYSLGRWLEPKALRRTQVKTVRRNVCRKSLKCIRSLSYTLQTVFSGLTFAFQICLLGNLYLEKDTKGELNVLVQ
ncbi:hypothetical protein DBR06_SOUSAS2410059, partial [Sousa chinensis]